MIAALLFIFGAQASAFELREMRMDYMWIQAGSRDPLLQQIHEAPTAGLNFAFDIELLQGVHFDNLILSLMGQSQFRMLAWDYRFYFMPWSWLEIAPLRHRSTHLFDIQGTERFPVVDGPEVRVKFHLSPKPKSSWF